MRSLLQFSTFSERAFVTFVLDEILQRDEPAVVTSMLLELDLAPVAVPSPYGLAARAAFSDSFNHLQVRTSRKAKSPFKGQR